VLPARVIGSPNPCADVRKGARLGAKSLTCVANINARATVVGALNRSDPCYIFYVTKQSPHPYYLKIRPCNTHVDRHRWEILDNEGLLQTSANSFATEREAQDNGRREMQGLVEMWNRK
jgi:hypothetical protein